MQTDRTLFQGYSGYFEWKINNDSYNGELNDRVSVIVFLSIQINME